MTLSWQTEKTRRFDRYIDWSERLRQFAGEDGAGDWCPVAVQIAAGGRDGPQAALKWLRDRIVKTRTGADDGGELPVRAQSAEELLIDRRIDEANTTEYETEDARLTFYVYLQQRHVYAQDGAYEAHAQFRIRFAGPPIRGLSFRPTAARAGIGLTPEKNLTEPVAIGVIDDAIGFANSRFHWPNATGTAPVTRIQALWLQDIEAADPGGYVAFGSQLNSQQINEYFSRALDRWGDVDEPAVYRQSGALDLGDPHRTLLARQASHGTHVLDLAAGADAESQLANTPIFAVQLPTPITEDTSGQAMASYALQGLRQMILWADHYYDEIRPISLVANFSYGFQAGPKDGLSTIECEIDRLIEGRTRYAPDHIRTAIVLPSGNSFDERTSARMDLAPRGQQDARQSIDWLIQTDDRTESYLEIWLPRDPVWDEEAGGRPPLRMTLETPDGLASPRDLPRPGELHVLANEDGAPIAGIYYDLTRPPAGCGAKDDPRPRLLLAVNRTNPRVTRLRPLAGAPAGRWRVTLENARDEPLQADLYIQRDDTLSGFRPGGRQSYFDHPAAYGRCRTTGNYDVLDAGCPIVHERSFSALVGGRVPLVIGAAEAGAQPRPAQGNQEPDQAPSDADFLPFTASLYSAKGGRPGRRGPFASAISDEGPAFPGIYATGVLSNSTSLLSGTSVAAPQVARALALNGADPGTLASASGPFAQPHSRLGRFVLARDENHQRLANQRRRLRA